MRQKCERLGWFWDFIPVLMWKYSICFIDFLIVFDRCSTFKLFYIIYILVGFNHIYMVTNIPINGLFWRFTEISNIEIIWCKPLLHCYTKT